LAAVGGYVLQGKAAWEGKPDWVNNRDVQAVITNLTADCICREDSSFLAFVLG
jgi:hypothetical protein